MALQQCISRLGGWEGYAVSADRTEVRQGQSWCVIVLEPVRGQPRCCSGCGQYCTAIHDLEQRRIRDLPLFEYRVELVMPRVRVACGRCGPKLERLSWLDTYARVTRRLADSVARLCQVASVLHVARFFGLDWKTVKDLDRAYLQRTLGPVDLEGIEVIALDEFAIQKGHRYATIFVEPQSKRVLWVCRGRGREDIRPFFEKLGPEGCKRIEAVAMDMSPAFEAEVRQHCPQAEIVYDQFHVVAKYGREVVDRVRAAEARRQTSRGDRQLVKGSRWLLLRNAENLKREDRVKLKELLAVNRRLATTYILKDDLKSLWTYRYADAAYRFWKEWYDRAIRSRIHPLKRFARNLREKIDGVLVHCIYPLHTSLLEGMNNKIKTLKRRAYGFRDDNYFFLKIRQAFPGIAG